MAKAPKAGAVTAKPAKANKRNGAPDNPKPDLVAELMLQRQERVNRARAAILEICQRERVDVVVAGFDVTTDGRLAGRLNIVAIDKV